LPGIDFALGLEFDKEIPIAVFKQPLKLILGEWDWSIEDPIHQRNIWYGYSYQGTATGS
jgi:hypothetical protein